MSGKELRVIIPYEPQNYQQDIEDSAARFKVAVLGRRAGKTEMAINIITDQAMNKPGRYWYIAPSYRQCKSIVWTRLKQLLANDPYWLFNEAELSATHKLRKTLIELKGADNEDSLRGVGLNGLVMDEAATIRSNVWPEILRPMLADKQGWALFISTPKGRNWLYDLYTKNDSEWKSWHFPTSVNQYIKPGEIAQARKDMSERLFKQEFLAEFLDDDTSVFKGVRSCTVGNLSGPVAGRYYVMGVDLAKTMDYTVLTVIDSITRQVVAFDRFQDIKWTDQKLRIQELAAKYNNAMCVIDASGVGDPVVEDLTNSNISLWYDDSGRPGFKFTNESKTQLIEQLQIAIEQRQVTFPNIEVLVDELKSYEYTITDSGNIKYGAPQGKHDDAVISLGLAVWGIRHQLHEAQVVINSRLDHALDRQGAGEIVNPIEELEASYAGY
jgi:hypothetical protein